MPDNLDDDKREHVKESENKKKKCAISLMIMKKGN